MLAKLIHSAVAFSLDWPVAEHNLQWNDLCNKTDISYLKTSRVFLKIYYIIQLKVVLSHKHNAAVEWISLARSLCAVVSRASPTRKTICAASSEKC